MNTIRPLVLYSILIFFGYLQSYGQGSISTIDFHYIYESNGDVTGDIICSKSDSIATLLIKLNNKLDSLKQFSLSYSLANTFDEKITKRTKLGSLSSYFQYEEGKASYYGMRAYVGSAQYFILWLTDSAKLIQYPIIKRIARNEAAADLALYQKDFNAPIISRYLSENTTVRLNTLDNRPQDLVVQYYDHHFLPAKPPMAPIADSTNVPLERDSILSLKPNDTIQFVNKGLYYVHAFGSGQGQSFIVTDEQFPQIASFDELVEALRYLATDEEYTKMTTSFNKKELFDKFWLTNTKSEDKAMIAVREYYQRVRNANEFFTSFKKGWKTDRGMIYIIFGPPSKVFFADNGVVWIYDKTFELPRVSFKFSLIETAFTEDHYVLERNDEYQNLWFRTVDLWRSGKKEY